MRVAIILSGLVGMHDEEKSLLRLWDRNEQSLYVETVKSELERVGGAMQRLRILGTGLKESRYTDCSPSWRPRSFQLGVGLPQRIFTSPMSGGNNNLVSTAFASGGLH